MAAKPLLNLLDLDRAGLERQFSDWGEKPYRAAQLMKWIYQRQVTDFELMSDLARALRARLTAETEIRLPELLLEQSAEDGTRKWLLRVDSGNSVEMVLIPDAGRHTLCISSQVGCALDCTFCATARQGFNRNLSTAEIVGQLWLATQLATPVRISNVVFMGMGEPLTNFDNVVRALSLFQDDFAWGLSKRRVTVSTSGVVPALRRLGQVTDVSLAVSLHAPTDELRNKLVPLNRKYPIAQLLEACAEYLHGQNGKRRITWEYVLIDGLNDGDAHARALARLIRHIPSKVNLIPFNPFPGTQFRRSSEARVAAFRDILLKRDLVTITRRTRGHDIAAACGQLAGRVQDRSRRNLKLPLVQVEA